MKFLLDMGVSPETGIYLMKLGHDAAHLIDEAMTHDLDFGKLLAFSSEKFPSVVIFRLKNMRPDNVNRFCERVIDRFSDELEQGAILNFHVNN